VHRRFVRAVLRLIVSDPGSVLPDLARVTLGSRVRDDGEVCVRNAAAGAATDSGLWPGVRSGATL